MRQEQKNKKWNILIGWWLGVIFLVFLVSCAKSEFYSFPNFTILQGNPADWKNIPIEFLYPRTKSAYIVSRETVFEEETTPSFAEASECEVEEADSSPSTGDVEAGDYCLLEDDFNTRAESHFFFVQIAEGDAGSAYRHYRRIFTAQDWSLIQKDKKKGEFSLTAYQWNSVLHVIGRILPPSNHEVENRTLIKIYLEPRVGF